MGFNILFIENNIAPEVSESIFSHLCFLILRHNDCKNETIKAFFMPYVCYFLKFLDGLLNLSFIVGIISKMNQSKEIIRIL